MLYEADVLERMGWLGDGSALVVAGLPSAGEQFGIRVIDVKTGQGRDLQGSNKLAFPSVSPDGRYLAAVTQDSKKLNIYDFSLQKWQEFTPASGAGMPAWSADSHYVYFDNGLVTDPAIFRLRISDQKIEQVANLKNLRRAIWGTLPWFGLSPKDEPLVLRDVGTQEVYALDFEEP